MRKLRVGVIGGGIIGVTTALCIKQNEGRDVDVTLVTDKVSPQTTGDGAAGIWGLYLLQAAPEDKRRWAVATHDYIENLWNSPIGGKIGVSLISFTRLNLSVEDALEWKDVVYGFREISQKELQKFGRLKGKHKGGYEFVTFTLEPIKYLPYAMKEFEKLGGKIKTGVLVKNLLTDLEHYDFDVIINCTGIGARNLLGDDSVRPLRGQVARVKAPWLRRVVLDDNDDGNYVIPNQDSTVIGGTHQIDNWNLTPDVEDSKFIWNGCHVMIPALKGAEKIRDWVGLRPGRETVRIDRESATLASGKEVNVIHNYGHGGSGITICWGCARDVLSIFEDIKNEKARLAAHL